MNLLPIVLAPFWYDLKNYRLSFLRKDLQSGLSVALMALPQAMAYAILANLPPSAGIWSVVFGTMFTAAFGCSRILISGTTNLVAILIQSGTSDILDTNYASVTGIPRDVLALQIMLQIAICIGSFQILASLFGLGRLTQFISRSVIVGYMAGAALAIAVTQLFPFLGIRDMQGYQPIYQKAWHLIGQIESLHWVTFFIGLGSLLLLILFHKTSQKIPGAALVFVFASLFVAVLHLAPENAKSLFEVLPGRGAERVTLVGDIGPISSGLPSFALPYFDLRILGKILPLAFALTLLTVLEATSIGRFYARPKDPPYNIDQEMYGLGIGQLACAFTGALPGSGSFSRSALNYVSGAKTRFAGVLSGLFVMLIVLVLGFLVATIPLPTISALMLFTAYTMVNYRYFFLSLKATPSDALVVLATFGSSLLFTLDVALYVGVVVSVALYLKKAAAAFLVEYTFNKNGKLRPLDEDNERLDARICIFQAEGELFFGAADLLQSKLREIAEQEGVQVVILQLLNVRSIDASVCLALEQTLSYFQSTHRHLLITGATSEVEYVLKHVGIIEKLGSTSYFPANERLPSEPTRDAYTTAKNLLS